MFVAKFHISILLVTYFVNANFIDKTSDNYGPYTVDYTKYYLCRGPKSTNLTTISYIPIFEKKTHSNLNDFDLTFLQETTIEELKLSVHTLKGDQKVPLLNYIVKKPCQHYALSKILEKTFNAQNCLVKKGNYKVRLNFTELTYNYFGTSFFYGDYIFKAVVFSTKGNVCCLTLYPSFKKKM